MKICFFIDSLVESAGSERMTVLLANHLAENNDEVHIITKQGGTRSFFTLHKNITQHALFEEKGINIYATYFTGLKKYNKIINQIQPDCIIDVCVAMSLMTLPVAAFKRKIKVISWELFHANAYFNIVTAKLSKWSASKFAYAVVVLTETDKKIYQKRFNPRRVSIIPNSIAVNTNVKADLQSKNVLAVGRLTGQKGFDMLLESWKTVAQQAADWKLRIAGAGELEAELKQQCSALGLNDSVEFLGSTLNVEKYYSSSSIFVMSSRFEGLPLAMIEAKASGLPLVSFDCETGPRDVIRNGVDGILVPPNNTGLLAEALLELINDESKRLNYGKRSQENLDNYLPQNVFAKWKQLIND